MKFLKCLIAYKGRNYTAANAFDNNRNMTQSWVMRPGDSFQISQFNYRGFGPTDFSVYNANHTYGDWVGRVNYGDHSGGGVSTKPEAYNEFSWYIQCLEDANENLYLRIMEYTTTNGPNFSHPIQLTEVIQDSIHNRISALTDLKIATQQLTPDNTNVDWNRVNQPVPMGQYLNTNGLIRNTRLIINKRSAADCNSTFPSASLSNHVHLLSESHDGLIQSYIDMENRIDHFLQTCGETQPIAATPASQITSNYHYPTSLSFSNPAVWCGGLYATPPNTTNVNGSTYSFCRSILSIKCGAGRVPYISSAYPGNKGYYNCVDEHNNLCGWCVPNTREQQFGSSWLSDDNTNYKAGIVINDGYGYITVHTCLQELMADFTNAVNEMQNASGSNTFQSASKGILPPLAIASNINLLNSHLSLRWGEISNNNIDNKPLLYDQCGSVLGTYESGYTQSFRDIEESGSNFYGTWGTYGIVVSTFETNNGGNDVNNSTQIYSPIHCLIMPSITSDWPALDIYGINRSRNVIEGGITSYYEQDEGCFTYRTIEHRDSQQYGGGPNQGPAAGSKVLHAVDIYKTIAMSTPNHLISQDIPPIS